MDNRIISGTEIAGRLRQRVAEEVRQFGSETGKVPGLAFILAGDNPASQTYVRMKRKACEEVGILSIPHFLPAETPESQILDLIRALNVDPRVHAILVQLPLPPHVHAPRVLEAVSPEKDVDGFHPVNVGKLVEGTALLVPCTPAGILELLDQSEIPIAGKRAVVLGRSNIVGKPVALLLLHRHATVTICHSRTEDLPEVTRTADILVAAIGKARFVTADMVKPGATVIDVGINREEGKIVGDVDFEGVKDKVSAITPVPGGVGPMTIALLLRNTLTACKNIERFPSVQAGREHSS